MTGFMTPVLAGMPSGTYKYRAESSNLSQWEIGEGVYDSGTGILTRTTVLYNSSGTGTASGQSGAGSKINFSAPPNVGVVQLVEDTLGVDQANSWSDTQKLQARVNIAVREFNRIINGGMRISQQNGSTAMTVTNAYPVDMFAVYFSGTTALTSQQVSSVTPGGSPNRLRTVITTADTSIAAGDFLILGQNIEGLKVVDLMWGTASAKPLTVSFGVKAPAGTYAVAVRNASNNRAYISEFVISGGEANTDVRKSVTIPGDTSGIWAKDNTLGMFIAWTLTTGSTYQTTAGIWQAGNYLGTSSTSNFSGIVSNTFELFDVIACEGAVAPAFVLPDYHEELIRCQRYFYAHTGVVGTPVAAGMQYTANLAIVHFQYPMMRGVPIITYSSAAHFTILVPSATSAGGALTVTGAGLSSARLDVATFTLSVGPAIYYMNNAAGALYVNARL